MLGLVLAIVAVTDNCGSLCRFCKQPAAWQAAAGIHVLCPTGDAQPDAARTVRSSEWHHEQLLAAAKRPVGRITRVKRRRRLSSCQESTEGGNAEEEEDGNPVDDAADELTSEFDTHTADEVRAPLFPEIVDHLLSNMKEEAAQSKELARARVGPP